MSVRDLIIKLQLIDDDKMVIISDGKGWCNIDKVEENNNVVLMMEKFPLFSDN